MESSLPLPPWACGKLRVAAVGDPSTLSFVLGKNLKVQKVGPKTKEEMDRNGKQLLQKKTSTSFSFEWSLWKSSSQQTLMSPGSLNIHWEPATSPSRSFKMGGIKALTPPQLRLLSHLRISVIHRQTYGHQSGKGG